MKDEGEEVKAKAKAREDRVGEEEEMSGGGEFEFDVLRRGEVSAKVQGRSRSPSNRRTR